MKPSMLSRNFLSWWFEVIDCKSAHSFVVGLLGLPHGIPAYIIRTPAVTYLNREEGELRTLFQDYQLGQELECVADCAFLLSMFGDEPFNEPQVALFSTPYQSVKH